MGAEVVNYKASKQYLQSQLKEESCVYAELRFLKFKKVCMAGLYQGKTIKHYLLKIISRFLFLINGALKNYNLIFQLKNSVL